MMYLCVLFVPPVYFMARKRWGAFILNAVLYGLGVLFLISIVGAVVAPIFWILAVGHAGWHLRKEQLEEHAEMIASKMAEKLRR
jgi:Mn2+/Fe2+ NRAMP family transporter